MSGWTVLLVILVLLPPGLLAVPVSFKARGRLRAGERRLQARIAWAGGLLAAVIEIKGTKTVFKPYLAGIALPVPRGKKKAGGAVRKDKTTGRKKKQRSGFPPASLILNRQLLAAVLGYLNKLLKSFNLRLRLSGIYGTDDPALTGLLAGLIAALHAEHYQIDLHTDFSGPVLDLEGETSGRIVPMVILWLTLRLFLAGPVRRIWWAILKRKFKRRNKLKEDAQYV